METQPLPTLNWALLLPAVNPNVSAQKPNVDPEDVMADTEETDKEARHPGKG